MSSTAANTVHLSDPALPQPVSRTFPSLANRNFRLLLSGRRSTGTARGTRS